MICSSSSLPPGRLLFSKGTIVDGSFIEAPSSTKNADKKRDPEMRSAKKGSNWHFGMKMHIGVDKATGIIHTVVTTTPLMFTM
ncbi:MAG: transposase [Parasutterella sp.]